MTFFASVVSKEYEKELDITKPRYKAQLIFSVPWPGVGSASL